MNTEVHLHIIFFLSCLGNLKDCTVPDPLCPSRQRGAWFPEVKNWSSKPIFWNIVIQQTLSHYTQKLSFSQLVPVPGTRRSSSCFKHRWNPVTGAALKPFQLSHKIYFIFAIYLVDHRNGQRKWSIVGVFLTGTCQVCFLRSSICVCALKTLLRIMWD